MRLRLLPLLVALGLFPEFAHTQDLFEIQVYAYPTVEPHHTMFEFHQNDYPVGTRSSAFGLYPNNHQSHFTLEITHGLSRYCELGGYLVTAYVPGEGYKYAGTRFRPRFRLPEDWTGPIKFSLSTELGFNKHQFDTDTVTLELRPIIEKEAGKFYFAVNPTFSKSFRGQNAHGGFEFEPAIKTSYRATKVLEPGLEYYGGTGSLTDSDPLRAQRHMIFPTLDLNVSDDWEFNVGVGRGLTASSEHWIIKFIIGRRFAL